MRLRKHLPLALFCAALLAAAPPAAAQPAAADGSWRTYHAPSKLFTAEFPGAPAYETRQINSGIRKETAHRYWLRGPGRAGALFEIMHMKMPPNDGDLPHGVLLDTTIDTVLAPIRQQGGREVGRSELNLKGCPGREFIATEADGKTVHGRVYLAGQQIFSTFYVSPASTASRQDARRFHDSFNIAEACAPQPAPTPAPPPKKLGKVSGARDAATGWMLIAPPQSGFSVLMPGAAEAEEEQAQEKPFPLVTRAYTAEDETAIYIAVECGDFPDEVNRVENIEEIKSNLGYRALLAEFEPMGVKVVPEGNFTVNGYVGRQYRLTSEDSTGRALVISSARKFYFFAVFAEGTTPPAAKFERFFSSLKIARP